MANQTKVLVVEDKESWRVLYEDTLKDAGYLPFSAEKIESALELIDRHFFHAALLDIVLDDLDQKQEQGMEVLSRLVQIGEQTGVVMMTGYPTTKRMDRAYADYGVTRFLEKPDYNAEKLLEQLAKASMQSEAYLDSLKLDTLRPQNLVRKYSPRDLEMRLLGRPSGHIAELLQSLLRHFVPLLICDEFERVESVRGSSVFETRYWSRMVGKEIVIRLGPRKHILQEHQELRDEGHDVVIDTRQSVSGLRYTVEGTSPSPFHDCPSDKVG
jgi:CheY-like chemotaxis protein